MDTIKDFLTEIGSSIKERLFNPIYVAFLISWATINYKLILVLIGDGKSVEKINYIDTALYKSTEDWWQKGFFYPAGAAVVYILISPFLYRGTMMFLKTVGKDTKKILYTIDDATVVDVHESAKMRQRFQQDRAGWIKERAELQAEIDASAPTITRLESEKDILAIQVADLQATADKNAPLAALIKDDNVLLRERIAELETSMASLVEEQTLYVDMLADATKNIEKQSSNNLTAKEEGGQILDNAKLRIARDKVLHGIMNVKPASTRLSPDQTSVLSALMSEDHRSLQGIVKRFKWTEDRLRKVWLELVTLGYVSAPTPHHRLEATTRGMDALSRSQSELPRQS